MVCPHVERGQYRTQEAGGCILGLEKWCGTGPGGSGHGAAMQRVGGGKGGSGRGLHICEKHLSPLLNTQPKLFHKH